MVWWFSFSFSVKMKIWPENMFGVVWLKIFSLKILLKTHTIWKCWFHVFKISNLFDSKSWKYFRWKRGGTVVIKCNSSSFILHNPRSILAEVFCVFSIALSQGFLLYIINDTPWHPRAGSAVARTLDLDTWWWGFESLWSQFDIFVYYIIF